MVRERWISLMTLGVSMFQQFSLLQNLEFFARILVACLCGAAIGYERSMRYKEAGIRTHIIVCCAAALMMIVSKYAFADIAEVKVGGVYGTKDTDPARIAAQVVTGISFLGAGIIFHHGKSISGLTTAAGVWATAGIGLAVGAGLYLIGIFTTIVIAMLQVMMHRFTLSSDSLLIGQVHFTVAQHAAFHTTMNDYFSKNHMQIISSKIAINADGSSTYDLTLRISQDMTMNELAEILASNEGVRDVSCELG